MKYYLFLMLIAVVSCTNENEARRVLEMDGVKDIQMTGYKFFACSDSDFYHTGFLGTRNGNPIAGVVCSGLFFKASTIRY